MSMNNTTLIKILTDLGLTKKEANVYFAGLQLGPTTVVKLAKTSGLKRTTIYSVVESLQQKGLIAVEVKGFKRLFVVENPNKLESILELRKAKLKQCLPEFSALFNLKGGESFIKYYEGLEAIKSVYSSLLKDIRPHEDYLVLAGQKKWHELDPEYFQKFIEKRAKLDINIKILMVDSQLAHRHKKFKKNYNEKIKILPAHIMLTTNLVIIPKKVIIHQLSSPNIAIVIENKSIVQMHREMFEIMWQAVAD